MENKIKHMEMIQSTINRISSNSFALKGWAVSLIAAIFVLANKDADTMYILLAYVPIIIFWGLDAYYLLQERYYRALYNKVRETKESDIDFSMDISILELKDKRYTFWSCISSPTEFCFYFPLAVLTAGIAILVCICRG